MVPQWFFDSVEKSYCCPEEEYGVDPSSGGGGREGEKKRGRGEEVPEWVSKLQEFKVPSVSDSYFLDGCKVRGSRERPCASDDCVCVFTAALLQWVLGGPVAETTQNHQPRWGGKVCVNLTLDSPAKIYKSVQVEYATLRILVLQCSPS